MRLNVFDQGRMIRDLRAGQALRSKQPILDRIDGIDRNLAIAALLNDAKGKNPEVSERAKAALIAMGEGKLLEKRNGVPSSVSGIDPRLAKAALTNDARHRDPEVRSMARIMLRELVAGAAIILLAFAPLNSHANEVKGKATIAHAEDKEAVADKAFGNATRQLGELSEETKAALAKIKEMVIAVVASKPVKVEEGEECEIGCLGKKKDIDPVTGKPVEEEPVVLSEYQFSIGDARIAKRFANALRGGLNGTKDVVVAVNGDTVTVRNTNNRQEMVF